MKVVIVMHDTEDVKKTQISLKIADEPLKMLKQIIKLSNISGDRFLPTHNH